MQVTLLAAGFVIGLSGHSIRAICEQSSANIQVSTPECWKKTQRITLLCLDYHVVFACLTVPGVLFALASSTACSQLLHFVTCCMRALACLQWPEHLEVTCVLCRSLVPAPGQGTEWPLVFPTVLLS